MRIERLRMVAVERRNELQTLGRQLCFGSHSHAAYLEPCVAEPGHPPVEQIEEVLARSHLMIDSCAGIVVASLAGQGDNTSAYSLRRRMLSAHEGRLTERVEADRTDVAPRIAPERQRR